MQEETNMLSLLTITFSAIGILVVAAVVIAAAVALAGFIFTVLGWLAGIAISALEAILGVWLIVKLIKAVAGSF